jgi:hypothetical protein
VLHSVSNLLALAILIGLGWRTLPIGARRPFLRHRNPRTQATEQHEERYFRLHFSISFPSVFARLIAIVSVVLSFSDR